MFARSPCPIPADLCLAVVLAHASCAPLGVWVSARRPLTVIAVRNRHRRLLLLDHDLGRLLRRCPSILVQLGPAVTVVAVDELVRIRALCVTTRASRLPAPEILRAFLPEALPVQCGAWPGVEVPLAQRSAEEVLAACAAARLPVRSSRIVYDERLTLPP